MTNIDDEIKKYLIDETKAQKIYESSAESENQSVPQKALETAKNLMGHTQPFVCPHCNKPITPFKKPLKMQRVWNVVFFTLAAAAFMLSFIFPRYFFQWLCLAVLFGLKWIVDQKATRTQVLIYKALKEDDETIPHRRSESSVRH